MRTIIVDGPSAYPGVRRDADRYKVYFIREGGTGAVKIGLAVKPRERMASLQCAHAYELDLLAYVKGGLDTERRLHQELAEDRLRGEWFRDSPPAQGENPRGLRGPRLHVRGVLPMTPVPNCACCGMGLYALRGTGRVPC